MTTQLSLSIFSAPTPIRQNSPATRSVQGGGWALLGRTEASIPLATAPFRTRATYHFSMRLIFHDELHSEPGARPPHAGDGGLESLQLSGRCSPAAPDAER